MSIRSMRIVAVLICTFLTTTNLFAQVHSKTPGSGRSTTGLIVGLNHSGSIVTMDRAAFGEGALSTRGREWGAGMHFTLGYQFTPTIGLLLHAGGVVLNESKDRTLGGVDLALRYSFARAEAVVPYLEIAAGGFALEDKLQGDGFELEGGSLALGAGLNYFVSPRFALNIDLRYNMGVANTLSDGSGSIIDHDGMGIDACRVNIGFNWYPKLW